MGTIRHTLALVTLGLGITAAAAAEAPAIGADAPEIKLTTLDGKALRSRTHRTRTDRY